MLVDLENLYDDVDVILSIMRPDEALSFVNKYVRFS